MMGHCLGVHIIMLTPRVAVLIEGAHSTALGGPVLRCSGEPHSAGMRCQLCNVREQVAALLESALVPGVVGSMRGAVQNAVPFAGEELNSIITPAAKETVAALWKRALHDDHHLGRQHAIGLNGGNAGLQHVLWRIEKEHIISIYCAGHGDACALCT